MWVTQPFMKSMAARIAAVLVLTGIYFLSGKLGLSLAFLNRSATSVWPPTGVALAALLIWGYRLWPGVFFGAFLVNITTQGSFVTTWGIATGNTLEALLGAWLINTFAGGPNVFHRTSNLFPYLLFAALLSTTISATCGVTSLCLSGLERWSQYGPVWATWWLGDTISNIIIAPLLLIWIATPAKVPKRCRALESAVLFLMVVVVGIAVFLYGSLNGTNHSLEYLTLPPLLWVAFRLEARGAITAALILAALALWGTLHGFGPFVRSNENESLLLLQAFMGAITITGLVLALLVSDSRRAEQRLQIQESASRALAEAPTLNEAGPRIVQALRQDGAWDWLALWGPDPATQELICVGLWHDTTHDLTHFEVLTRQTRLKTGFELAKRVWKSGDPTAIAGKSDAENFPRAMSALAAGFHTLVLEPIRVRNRISGFVELFKRAKLEPEDEFLHLLQAIGNQVGQFIERKQAEEGQARLAAIVESSPDAIIGKTLEGTISSWNEGAHRIFGYSAEEVLGKSIALIIPPERLQEENAILTRLKQGEQIASYETVRVRKDGILIDIALTVSPIKDASGNIIGAAKIARDITEQKATGRALAETREMLRRYAEDLEQRVQERTSKLQETIQSLDAFCYTIAHDLRGPLRSIIGFSAQLLDQYQVQLDKEGIEYLSRIKNSGNRMDQLILDLLKYGRLNTTELVLETIDVEELIRKVLRSFEEEIARKLPLIKLREPLLPVWASVVILEQVLANLMSNALKFVPANTPPQIEIWTEAQNGRVRLCMRDNGIGIKPQYFTKLFRPFSRLVNEQDFSGTGIGLAIVSKGVERMGGTVGVQSEPGKGSCFWVELPPPPVGNYVSAELGS